MSSRSARERSSFGASSCTRTRPSKPWGFRSRRRRRRSVEVVRAMIAGFNRSGFLPEDLFDPEVELFNIRESPLPGPYRGYAGLLEWRQGVFEVIDEGR